jgi:type IV secretory pathway TraG/TraD family ATPase VirD4
MRPDTSGENRDTEVVRSQAVVMAASRAAGHGAYLGRGVGGPSFATPEHCVLVLGPPRSGKTSGIVIPNVLAACGSVVAASTKPDVLLETASARRRVGSCVLFDPSGRTVPPDGVDLVGWSPVHGASSWDVSVLTADAMVGAARPSRNDAESTHWSERASALLSCLLHATCLGGSSLDVLVSSVNRHDATRARAVLARAGADLASDVLEGILATDAREQSGIWSTASGILSAYRTSAALASARLPAFDARHFVEGRSTLYIATSAEHQRHAAPIVAGILRDIRSAAYDLAARRLRARQSTATTGPVGADGRDAPLLLVLDELAGIAPLHDLGTLVAEGASQGITTLACLQDLSQARRRWGVEADGFLTLFGTVVVLGGIGDTRTLESLSVLAGEVDVEHVSKTTPTGILHRRPANRTVTTQRLRRLPPDRIANPPRGAAVVYSGTHPSSVVLTPRHETEPWRSIPGRTPTRSLAGQELRTREARPRGRDATGIGR